MSVVVAILKAIPIVDGFIQAFILIYCRAMVGSWKKENLESLRKILDEHDQRALEKTMGSTTAGKPSGDAGSIIVDAPPPGVSLPPNP